VVRIRLAVVLGFAVVRLAVVLGGLLGGLLGRLLGGLDRLMTVVRRALEREGDGELQRLMLLKMKWRQVPVIGPEIDPGMQRRVSRHHPQRGSFTQGLQA